MKRLLGSLAWYWASCRSIAASRALLVPGDKEVQAKVVYKVQVSHLLPRQTPNQAVPQLTTAHHAHGKDGVVGDLGVSIMGELAESIKDVEPGIGD